MEHGFLIGEENLSDDEVDELVITTERRDKIKTEYMENELNSNDIRKLGK